MKYYQGNWKNFFHAFPSEYRKGNLSILREQVLYYACKSYCSTFSLWEFFACDILDINDILKINEEKCPYDLFDFISTKIKEFAERYEIINNDINYVCHIIHLICQNDKSFQEFLAWENTLEIANVWPCMPSNKKYEEISIDCNYEELCAYLSYTNKYGENALFANEALYKIMKCRDRLYSHIIEHPYACSERIAEKLIGIESYYEFDPFNFDKSLPIFSLIDILDKIGKLTNGRAIRHRFTPTEFVACSTKENPFEQFDWSQAQQFRLNNPNDADIFFIGMPNSGKTSLIMGLLCTFCNTSGIQSISSPYSSLLSECCDMGKMPKRSPDFETEQLCFQYTPNKKHWWSKYGQSFFSCIETSGNALFQNLLDRKDGVSLFEEMDYDVAKMFCSKNKKIIFIVVDPLCDITLYTYKKNGEGVYYVGQRYFIQRFIDILEYNSKVLKNVLSINVIITKTDRLSGDTRGVIGRYTEVFSGIERLCQNLKTNKKNDYKPKVFNFSLGNVFWGDVFEYDDTDAKEIVEYIKCELY